ncbi:tyrosine protein kinase [Variovorax paradoxus]|jgi:tyrosine-protein kinase Etk/Wzc|uniref:polysaccharide biosynthesis tyrosine autokinase n=1 Tax=Variovorax paradoxus TaxID=34073 RepID=UPI0006E4C7B9|nr:tyrosine protein kinase [Variovorax paradoxus]KPU91476.1 tyrosine protein kinase [Variovorax paradoxus]KPU92577.1 tyrosine protein kinase [Variovorax paradoxus]KPV14319.1 tyrosine protein kinase [Variovorax paradoxus]KPV20846.1 tyrosine protein kinase [Variovorax paradoxus]
MNSFASAQAPSGPAVAPSREDDENIINLSEYLDILIDRKWLVMAITTIAVALGVAYTLLATPVYQSNLLVQVEDSAPDAKNFLGDTANLFDVKTPATGEIQIIRSRMIMGGAVDATRLYIDARPRYIPIVGEWLARRAKGLSEPGFLGMGGYVSGTEAISISKFDVPSSLEDQKPFTITVQSGDQYVLTHPDLDEPLTGTVGKLLSQQVQGGAVVLVVSRLNGKPGAQFTVSRASVLVTTEELQRRVQLSEQGKQSNVISATLEDSDRDRLRRILDEIGVQYVRQNVERKAAEAEKTLEFLDKQLPNFKKQLESSEDVYADFRNKNGTIAFDEEAKAVLGQAVQLQTKLLESEQVRRELLSRFTESNPKVRVVDGQIVAFRHELDSIERRVSAMPVLQRDALRLERDVRVNGELYKSLLNSSLQLRLVKEGKVGNVRLLDKATEPKRPVKPQKPLIVGLSLVLGLLSGVALAIIRSKMASGIHNPQEIEDRLGLSVYSVVPQAVEQDALLQLIATGAGGAQVLAVTAPESLAIESLRNLRISLQLAMLESGSNRVLVTGATPGVGKSFVSSNYAVIMAQAGKRVLLIDADLRKGHINKSFGLPRQGGLADILAGDIAFEKAIHDQVLPNLDVLTTGNYPFNPANMMLSSALGDILDVASQRYDLVVLDSPPVLVAADAAAVSAHVGAILLVARDGLTQIGELGESVKRLAHANQRVSGVVFNGMDLSRRHYGSYGYKYGGYRYTEYKYKQAD